MKTLTQTFINLELLETFDRQAFLDRQPFPWVNLEGFLTPEGFEVLDRAFPPLDLFEKHSGIERAYGQRPHNRYYLAYESSIYQGKYIEKSDKGIVRRKELPQVWQEFMTDLETNEPYHSWIQSLFGVTQYNVRYAWHVGFRGCEVSPHMDSPDKVGTHILYFNTSEAWKAEWGGATLVLSDKQTESLNPNVSDFGKVEASSIVDNRSFLFKNDPNGWHGVEPLNCPDGAYRRLFNIIFEFPEVQPSPTVKLRSLIKKIVHR